MATTVSSDLLWAITRNSSSFVVKRGPVKDQVIFTKEPLNLVNKHTYKHSGLVNNKAVGIQQGEHGNVILITKQKAEKHGHKPATLLNTVTFSKTKSNRKHYSAIVGAIAKNYYRPDLRQAAVARASAIKRSQRPVKPTPAAKLRGAKARKAVKEGVV